MMSIEINVHKLPPVLARLIEEWKWGRQKPIAKEVFNKLLEKLELPLAEKDLITDSLKGKRDWSIFGSRQQSKAQLFEVFGLASSKDVNEIPDEIIDVDKAIFIAISNYDETIALDYRLNTDNPRVMYTEWGEVTAKWRMIAPDFETFAKELGLVE